MIFSMLVVPHVVDKIFFEEGEEKKVVLVKNTVTYYLESNAINDPSQIKTRLYQDGS